MAAKKKVVPKKAKEKVVVPKVEKNNTSLIIGIILAVLFIAFIGLILIGGITLILFMDDDSSLASPSSTTSSSYMSTPSFDESVSTTAIDDENCEYTVTGTISNPNSDSISGVGLDCIVTKSYGGSGSMLHGSHTENLGTISGNGGVEVSFTIEGWKYGSDSCYDYYVDCDVEY